MFGEPHDNFIYSSYKIEAHFDVYGKLKTGSGTGFVIEHREKGWIVTNRHVAEIGYIDSKYKDAKLIKFSITGRKSDDSTYTFELGPEARILYHQDFSNDVVLIEPYIKNIHESKRLHFHFGFESIAGITEYNEIRPFDLICCTGFPDQYDKLGNRPILRSGHIASDPKYDYSWDHNYHGKCVAYEGFSLSGASGGPIFAPYRGMSHIPNSRDGFIIGVNAGHVNYYDDHNNKLHSNISYFYKSTVIHEILEQLDIATSPIYRLSDII